MKQLMLGNAAVARGLYEAGCCVISSYPGTPSTEITEEAAKFDDIYCEWGPQRESGYGGGLRRQPGWEAGLLWHETCGVECGR